MEHLDWKNLPNIGINLNRNRSKRRKLDFKERIYNLCGGYSEIIKEREVVFIKLYLNIKRFIFFSNIANYCNKHFKRRLLLG